MVDKNRENMLILNIKKECFELTKLNSIANAHIEIDINHKMKSINIKAQLST